MRFTRTSARQGVEFRQQALLSEQVVVRVQRLADTIREEDESVTCVEFKRLGDDGVCRQQSEHESGGCEDQLRRLPRRDSDRGVVSRARAGDDALRKVEHQTLKGHEHSSRVLLPQLVVELAQDLFRGTALPRQAAQERHRHCHEQRRRDAFARHVTHRHEHAGWTEPQNLEEIAAHLPRGLQHRVHLEPGSLNLRRKVRGQKTHLNLAGNAKVPFRRFLHGLRIRFGLQQRTDARLDFQHLEWLRQVVVAPGLESARLVVHILERAEKHHRQVRE